MPNTLHGNLFTDSKGVMYSYGTHYPLLFKINGLSFVNVSGYSQTTAKHINYARPFAQYEVELTNSSTWGACYPTYDNVLRALNDQLEDINETLYSLKRHGTKKENTLLSEKARIEKTIIDLKASK